MKKIPFLFVILFAFTMSSISSIHADNYLCARDIPFTSLSASHTNLEDVLASCIGLPLKTAVRVIQLLYAVTIAWPMQTEPAKMIVDYGKIALGICAWGASIYAGDLLFNEGALTAACIETTKDICDIALCIYYLLKLTKVVTKVVGIQTPLYLVSQFIRAHAIVARVIIGKIA